MMERRFLLNNLVFLTGVFGVIFWLSPSLMKAFLHNPILNGVILCCIGIGIFSNFLAFFKIKKEKKWLESFEKGTHHFPGIPQPKILHPLWCLTNESTPSLSQQVFSSTIDGVDGRLSEMRDLGRYLTGLLIFLGLLGTFWGLSQTVGAIAHVIGALKVSSADVAKTFEGLKDGLQSPLSGMGTAFSSSMFGLAGSLILGFMDMQSVKMLNIFSRKVQSVLSRFVRSESPMQHIQNSGAAFSQGLLEQTAENLHHMSDLFKKNDEQRGQALKVMIQLTERVGQLTEHLGTQQHFFKRLLQQQEQLETLLQNMNNTPQDETVKQHLRSIDATLMRLVDDITNGRQNTTHELKSEIRMVARTISALANQEAA